MKKIIAILGIMVISLVVCVSCKKKASPPPQITLENTVLEAFALIQEDDPSALLVEIVFKYTDASDVSTLNEIVYGSKGTTWTVKSSGVKRSKNNISGFAPLKGLARIDTTVPTIASSIPPGVATKVHIREGKINIFNDNNDIILANITY